MYVHMYVYSFLSDNGPLHLYLCCQSLSASKSGRIVRNFFYFGFDRTSVAVAIRRGCHLIDRQA